MVDLFTSEQLPEVVVTLFNIVKEQHEAIEHLQQNLLKLQKALILTNEKMAQMDGRQSSIVDLNGRRIQN